MPPIEIFFSYAHEDEDLMHDVRRQLVLFERQGRIVKWYDRQIRPGAEWNRDIDQHLRNAQIVLLFVSPNFFESDYAYGAEMTEALRRHDAGEARVIPIILRPCPWTAAPFAKLQALPRDGRAITLWRNRDEACLDVAEGIMNIVAELAAPSPETSADSTGGISRHQTAKDGLVARLEYFKRLLDESWYVFRTQQKRIRKLNALLEQRLGSRVPNDIGYDETFFRLYDELTDEEKELFKVIRTITGGRMRQLNEDISQWASRKPLIDPVLPRSPAAEHLEGKLDQLKLHLDLWFDRYKTVFASSERRSIVFLDDLKVPGVSFPENLNKAVDNLLADLRQPGRIADRALKP